MSLIKFGLTMALVIGCAALLTTVHERIQRDSTLHTVAARRMAFAYIAVIVVPIIAGIVCLLWQ